METHRRQFDQINSQGRQLSGQCDGQTSLKINEITQRIQQQWTSVEQRLQTVIEPSRDVVEHWRIFNSSYVYLLDRLSELETRWYAIQRDKFTTDTETLLEKAQVNKMQRRNFLFIERFCFYFSSGFSTTFTTDRSRNQQITRSCTKIRSTSSRNRR